jgi:hypothetical protein
VTAKDTQKVLELCRLVATKLDPKKLVYLIAELARVMQETEVEDSPEPMG